VKKSWIRESCFLRSLYISRRSLSCCLRLSGLWFPLSVTFYVPHKIFPCDRDWSCIFISMHSSRGSRLGIYCDFDHFLEVIELSNLISRRIDTLHRHSIYRYNMYRYEFNSFEASVLLRWDTHSVFSLDSICSSEYEPSQTLSSQQNGFTCLVVQHREEIDLPSSILCLEIFFLLLELFQGSSVSSMIKSALMLLLLWNIERIQSSLNCFQKLCNCYIQSLSSCRLLLSHNKKGAMKLSKGHSRLLRRHLHNLRIYRRDSNHHCRKCLLTLVTSFPWCQLSVRCFSLRQKHFRQLNTLKIQSTFALWLIIV
jgi:hypothetical protein